MALDFLKVLGIAALGFVGYKIATEESGAAPRGSRSHPSRPKPGVAEIDNAAYSMSKAVDDLSEGVDRGTLRKEEASGGMEWLEQAETMLTTAGGALTSQADRELADSLAERVAALNQRVPGAVGKRAATVRNVAKDSDRLFREVALFDKRINPDSSWKHIS